MAACLASGNARKNERPPGTAGRPDVKCCWASSSWPLPCVPMEAADASHHPEPGVGLVPNPGRDDALPERQRIHGRCPTPRDSLTPAAVGRIDVSVEAARAVPAVARGVRERQTHLHEHLRDELKGLRPPARLRQLLEVPPACQNPIRQGVWHCCLHFLAASPRKSRTNVEVMRWDISSKGVGAGQSPLAQRKKIGSWRLRKSAHFFEMSRFVRINAAPYTRRNSRKAPEVVFVAVQRGGGERPCATLVGSGLKSFGFFGNYACSCTACSAIAGSLVDAIAAAVAPSSGNIRLVIA